MAIERTLSIIKPDITRRNLTGSVIKILEDRGIRIVASRRIWMSEKQAQGFYYEHKERPFFNELCSFMSSGPSIVQVLEGDNAILKNREIMGHTDPSQAEEGTIRKMYGISIGENSIHGSDSPETVKREIGYWFSEVEIIG